MPSPSPSRKPVDYVQKVMSNASYYANRFGQQAGYAQAKAGDDFGQER